jgi:hypothetical protein
MIGKRRCTMAIQILIEPVANNGFRATSGEPLAMSAEGPTREAALGKLRKQLQARLKNGAELVLLELSSEPNPWLEFAGMFKDDPWIDDWKQSMREYRQERDAEPDLP